MNTKEKKLMKQQEVVGGYNAGDYVTERLYAKAKDGTTIPISVVYKKGFQIFEALFLLVVITN
jgi:oligopeptidase B